MSVHTGGLLVHLYDARRNDFLEMLLHHTVTIYLLGFSYMFNVWETGTVVLFLHDSGEITVSLTRLFTETEYKKTTVGVFLSNTAIWFYARLIVFP